MYVLGMITSVLVDLAGGTKKKYGVVITALNERFLYQIKWLVSNG